MVTVRSGFIDYYVLRILFELRGRLACGYHFNDDMDLKPALHKLLNDSLHLRSVSADVSDRDVIEVLFSFYSILPLRSDGCASGCASIKNLSECLSEVEIN